eukprot:Pgem_evm1s10854
MTTSRRSNDLQTLSKEEEHLFNCIKDDCGEDAYFMYANDPDGIGDYMGVADGVGGWQDLGVNPALFSWSLMNNCNDILKDRVQELVKPEALL